MKKSLSILSLLFVISQGLFAQFTNGNIVVSQVGDGTGALGSGAAPVFLKEFTTAGAATYSVVIPTTGAARLVNAGTATTEELITRSTDGQYIVMPGYDAATGTAAIAGTSTATVSRVVDTISFTGGVGRAVTSGYFSAGTIRGVAADGNNNYWGTGSTTGVCYFGTASTNTVVSNTSTNTRALAIYNSQLYFSTGAGTHGIYAVGTGTPVNGNNTSALVITLGSSSSPYQFAFNATTDVCYVADDRTIASGGGIQKWTLSGGIWSLAYTLGTGAASTVGTRGICVDWSGANPVIYATTSETNANRIITITDAGSGSVATTLTTAATNTAFRGITFSPYCAAPVISTVTNTGVACDNNLTLNVSTSAGAHPFFYAWSGAGTFNSSTVQSPNITSGAATGMYSVTVTNKCSSTSSTVSVTVNASPTVTANSATVCANTATMLTANGASTYTWSPAATLSSATGTTVTATTSLTTNYTVTGTDVNGCVNAGTATLTINTLPSVQANTTATVVCAGDMITLTGSGTATTYTWSSSVVDGTAFAPATGTDTYTVTGTDANNCSNMAVITVTVNALPSVQANTTATVVCAGDMITLTGGGATTYTWSSSVVDGTAFAPATGTDTYTVSGTDANNCSNMAVVTVTVNALPNVQANTTATVVCAGDMITLTGGGATTYTWSSSVIDGTAFTPATGTDTYTVTGTDANNCSNMAVVTVTVNTLPSVQANTTATVVCAGDMITLTGGGATTYTWSGSVVDGTAFAPATGTDMYTVIGIDANNCSNIATVTVTVNTLPSVQANTTATVVCAGDMITLTGSGATTYTWSSSVVDGSAFAPSATDTYTVTGTDANNCMNSASVMVTVNNLPTVNANATATVICAGDMTTLTGGGTATTYTWTASVVDGVAFAPSSTDTYTVTGTDANNCSNMASIMVTVNNVPTVNANATATVVCAGGMTTLTATGTATSYTWSSSVIDGTAFTPATGTDTYTVTGTDANNCSNMAMVTVTVNTLPSVQANTTATVVCAGDMITLTGGGATTYTWSSSVVDGTAFTPATGTDTYTVTGTDGNNCSNTASVTVIVNSIPSTPTVTQAGNVLSSTVTGSSYQWYFNTVAIATNGTSATYTATANGVYQVEVFNASNCSSMSATYTVTTVGIESFTTPKNVRTYPNPANSFITVEADAKITLIEIYDITGKVVISEMPAANIHTIQLNNVEPGIYFLKTERNNQISVQKIIVR